MSFWYGYEQRLSADATRPWWEHRPPWSAPPGLPALAYASRRDGYTIREEGPLVYQSYDPKDVSYGPSANSEVSATSALDASVPMPVPDPLVGQVWVFTSGPNAGEHRIVCAVSAALVGFAGAPGLTAFSLAYPAQWPPLGDLVAGPLHPWRAT